MIRIFYSIFSIRLNKMEQNIYYSILIFNDFLYKINNYATHLNALKFCGNTFSRKLGR